MFFPLANEQAQQNAPVKISVLPGPICISDRGGYAHGEKGGTAECTIFQHKCTTSLWA